MRIRIRTVLLLACVCCNLACLASFASGQDGNGLVALVDGRPVTEADLKQFLPPNFKSLDLRRSYAVKKVALENTVISFILAAEARRRRTSVSMLRKQMTKGRVSVPDARVEEEYRKNAKYFALLSPDEAKERLRLHLEVDERMKFYRAALAGLRASAKVQMMLNELERETVNVTDVGPSDGPDSAPVTITVFSDFQCPYCRHSQRVLAQILEQFPSDVRLVFRHFPLAGIPDGMSPATAAVCADEQGMFWEFHDALYASSTLTDSEVRSIVAGFGFNDQQFEKCLASSTPYSVINRDLAEARRLGITGTPTFIVNGKLFNGKLEFLQFKKLIESELRSSSRGPRN